MTNSRAKGIRGENEAAKLWRRWFPEARRSFGQAREGFEQPDLLNTGQFFVEVKRYEKEPSQRQFREWWDKMIADYVKFEKLNGESDGLDPVLMWRKDKGEWEIAMYGALAMDLLPLEEAGVVLSDDIIYRTLWKDFAQCVDLVYKIVNP